MDLQLSGASTKKMILFSRSCIPAKPGFMFMEIAFRAHILRLTTIQGASLLLSGSSHILQNTNNTRGF